MNRLKIAVLGSTLAVAGLCAYGTANAADENKGDQAKGPQISRFLAKPLKAAQDAMKAQKFDDEIAKLKEAQAAKGEKSAYDDYVINAMLGAAYAGQHDGNDAAPALQAAALSQYATAEQQKAWLTAVVGIYYQKMDYPKAIEAGQQALKHGVTSSDMYATIALAQNALGKYKDAAATIQQVIGKQSKPDEKFLVFQWTAYTHAKDQADASKVIEKLVTYYPKPDYWLNALNPLLHMNISDAHLQLDVYRLMDDVGVLKQPRDYAEMAELAFDEGYPGEAATVLEKAFAQNAFTDPRDIMRYQHLLTGAKQRAAADQAQLPAQEEKASSAATGDQLVAVGSAYLSYGQFDKAISALTRGIAKGGLKYPEQASVLLGVAQLRTHKIAEAQKSFDKAADSGNAGYAQLGKLWGL